MNIEVILDLQASQYRAVTLDIKADRWYRILWQDKCIGYGGIKGTLGLKTER